MADLTVIATPMFFGAMGLEHRYLKQQSDAGRAPIAGDYTREDTIASLAMGVGSLVVPRLMRRALLPITPGTGRWGKALVGVAIGAAVATTAADVIAKRNADALTEPGVVPDPTPTAEISPSRSKRRRVAMLARRVSSSTGVAAVSAGIVAGTTSWAAKTAAKRLWGTSTRDLGTGVAATVGAIVAWDFIYYWNHRLMHESRLMWAIHVVHHSSEHYNLSTALRQSVGDVFGFSLPTGLLAVLGFRPDVIETARGVNLLYQYWIHTETIGKLGPIEEVFNTASHHRVHHGSNQQYLDRNHGSIFIIWDRLFGTFEREDEPVRYGLTKNIDTYNPLRIATQEHRDILRDVAASHTWRDRLGFVFRGPGWAYDRHREGSSPVAPPDLDSVLAAPLCVVAAGPVGSLLPWTWRQSRLR